MRKTGIFITILLSCLLNSGADVYCDDDTALVLGAYNEVRDKRWKDERIGFGVRNILSQQLYDSGAFTLLEEKEEIRQKLRDVGKRMWNTSDKKHDAGEEFDALDIAADYGVYCRIYYFGRPQTRMSVGVFKAKVVETILRVEVIIEDIETGKTWRANGTGKAETTANSLLFSIRENDVLFDETAVGEATQKAIAAALGDAIDDFKKSKR